MTRIVQIAPEIGPGTGVGSVAYHLEQEWQRRGVAVDRFTMEHAHGEWLPKPQGGIRGRLALAVRVVWFSIVGTVVARHRLRLMRREDPETVAVCHNDVLAGDIYVNHGIVQAAMRARGNYLWRMFRNPLHAFTYVRDRARYAGYGRHLVVVNLVKSEEDALRRAYPRLRVPTVVIGNGVDTNAFRPDPLDRSLRRDQLGFTDADRLLLFVGHEYERKGLPLVVEALSLLPDYVHLLVVGGSEDMVAHNRAAASYQGVAHRVHHVGRNSDTRAFFHAADVFVLPSAYESYGLVVLEALATGLPVVATATGCVPDVVKDGVNGCIVEQSASDIARAIRCLDGVPTPLVQRSAQETASHHTWSDVADQYLELISERIMSAEKVGPS